ncbi:catalase family peroxidase [Amycolatopsis sp. H20-H5]|uniref:catalase family peroxidase n=1 Tax=Amycolatopsis sp. H20-H5 TaxID=3046309 RepID=UPI002DBAE409|nr:catalase family peroxidase [Amycolatopsis sp. H20-H5]MEC3979669.1 catalase family peroxidase [Amycolatopsis sp. H20-H5]
MTSELAKSQISATIVDDIEHLKGTYAGYRRAHARGVCYDATFTPSGEAAALTTAPHLQSTPVPATVRFSHTDTNPHLRDADRAVRGFATKFHLPDGGTTDLIGVNLDRFVASTPEQFRELIQAAQPDPVTGKPDLQNVRAYAGAHPTAGPGLAAAAVIPTPVSYASATYWAIHAFFWRNAAGEACAVKYRWVPDAGNVNITPEEGAGWSATHLAEELAERLKAGPAGFTLVIQLGEEGDNTDDSTQVWPADRTEITAGHLSITGEAADQEHWADQVFDPTQLPEGIEVSADPVLAARSTIYAVSYDRRIHKR